MSKNIMDLRSEPHGGTLTKQVLCSIEGDQLLKDKNRYFTINVDFETALDIGERIWGDNDNIEDIHRTRI